MVEKTCYDGQTRYCPRLGHTVPFSYCRNPGSDIFCRNITACWNDRLDTEEYLKTHYTAEEREAAGKQPKPKVTSLIELIEQAKKRAAGR